MKCDISNCGGTFSESIKCGPFEYCKKHFDGFQKICNVKGCDNLIALSDVGRWIICPEHKEMDRTDYKTLKEIGFKNET
jgi:hypothetical protein